MTGPAPRWIGTYQLELLRQAHLREVPLFYRVHLAALGSAYADGHAPFFTNELAEVVAATGSEPGKPARLPDASELRKAIRRAKETGLLHVSSGVRCLVLPGHLARRTTGRPGESRCRVHAQQ